MPFYDTPDAQRPDVPDPSKDRTVLGEVARGIGAGATGAVRSTIGLADTLLFDAIPDSVYDKPWVTEPSSTYGRLIEGVAQFTTGMVIAGGPLSKALASINGVEQAGLAVRAALGDSGAAIVGNAAKAAVTTFTAFDGHAGRLSDVLKDLPVVGNAATRWLASDTGDPELLGRLKNAIEGSVLGAAGDALFLGIKRLGAFRRAERAALQSGASPQEAEAAGHTAAEASVPASELKAATDQAAPVPPVEQAPSPEQARRTFADLTGLDDSSIDAVFNEAQARAGNPDLAGVPAAPALQGSESVMLKDLRPFFDDTAAGGTEGQFAALSADLRANGQQAPITLTYWPKSGKALLTDGRKRFQALAGAGYDSAAVVVKKGEGLAPAAAKPVVGDRLAAVKGSLSASKIGLPTTPQVAEGGEGAPVRVNPRRQGAVENALAAIGDHDLNLAKVSYEATSDIDLHTMRAISGMFEPLAAQDAARLSDEALAAQAAQDMQALAERATGDSTNVAPIARMLGMANDSIGEVRKAAVRARALDATHRVMVHNFRRLVAETRDPTLPDVLRSVKREQAKEYLGLVISAQEALSGLGTAGGQFLRSFNMRMSRALVPFAEQLAGDGKQFVNLYGSDGRATEIMDAARAAMEKTGGQAIDKLLEAADTALQDGPSGMRAMPSITQRPNGLSLALDLFMNSVLSGPDTWSVNIMGPFFQNMLQPLQRTLGGVVRRDRVAVESGLMKFMGLFQDWGEAVRMARRSFSLRRSMLFPDATTFDDNLRAHSLRRQLEYAGEASGKRTPGVWSAAAHGIEDSTVQGHILNALDYVIGIPRAVITAGDEFNKVLATRSNLRDIFWRQGLSAKVPSEDLPLYVKRLMDKAIVDGRSASNTHLMEVARAQATKEGLTGGQHFDRVEQLYHEFSNDPERPAVNTALKESERLAEEAAATAPLTDPDVARNRRARGLKDKTLGTQIQDIVAYNPVLRFVLPFVRTPLNLARQTFRQFDFPAAIHHLSDLARKKDMPEVLATAFSTTRRDLAAGGVRAADAVGRLTTGTAIAAYVMTHAANGRITGGGPDNPAVRQTLLDAGWLPYSIKVGDSYVQYGRLDPIAGTIGLVADTVEAATWADPEHTNPGDRPGLQAALSGMIVAIAHQVTDKTFLTGIRTLTDAASQPESYGVKAVTSVLDGFVPNVLNRLKGLDAPYIGDPVQRDVRTLLDGIKNRVPLLSAQLEPRRNVLGEPIHMVKKAGGESAFGLANVFMPIAYSTVSDDVVNRELAALNHGWSPPSTTRFGLDLTAYRSNTGQTLFDRWTELQGTLRLGGRDLRESLRRLVTSRRYRGLSAEPTSVGDSPRVSEINRLVRRYREAAWDKAIQQYPQARLDLQSGPAVPTGHQAGILSFQTQGA
jgi:hypothetical protein